MSSSLSFQIDQRSLNRFQAAMREYAEVRKKDNEYVCNRQGAQLALRAFWLTDKAKSKEVAQFATGTYVSPTGKVYEGESRARALVIGRLRKAGRALFQAEIARRTKALVAGRIRSGFIAAGWIPALRKFKAAGIGSPRGQAPRRKPGYGTATLARRAIQTFSEIINRSVVRSSETGVGALLRYGQEGLRKAIPEVTRDMEKFIAGQLDKAARKVNSR